MSDEIVMAKVNAFAQELKDLGVEDENILLDDFGG